MSCGERRCLYTGHCWLTQQARWHEVYFHSHPNDTVNHFQRTIIVIIIVFIIIIIISHHFQHFPDINGLDMYGSQCSDSAMNQIDSFPAAPKAATNMTNSWGFSRRTFLNTRMWYFLWTHIGVCSTCQGAANRASILSRNVRNAKKHRITAGLARLKHRLYRQQSHRDGFRDCIGRHLANINEMRVSGSDSYTLLFLLKAV